MRSLFGLLLLFLLLMPAASAYYHDGMIPAASGFLPAYNSSYPGERNAGQWYEFSLSNVSGYKGVKYHFTVYDAEIKNNYQYRSDSWGQWWTEYPAPGKKFIFVWICGYSSGTSWIGWGGDRFAVWNNAETIKPEKVRYSDLVSRISVEGFPDKVAPRTIRFLENRTSYKDFPYTDDVYGYKDGIEQDRMEPGKSNAWNGYLIYQVPASAKLKDLKLAGWFGINGTAWWNLEPRAYIQDSPEYVEIKEKERLQEQIRNGVRVRDDENLRRMV